MAAARDLAYEPLPRLDLLARSRDSPGQQSQPYEAAGHAHLSLAAEDLSTGKVDILVESQCPAQAGLQRRRPFAQLVSVQAEPGFQAQGVPGGQAGWPGATGQQ